MNDWTPIKTWWNGLNEDGDTAFVAVRPPTRERYTQDEGHEDAAQEIADRQLPADTPYAVWHWQAHRFDRSGRLTGSNPIYFGGDRARVSAKLATVPDGYRIEGGTSDADAFLLLKNRDLHTLDPAVEPDASELLGELRSWRASGLSGEEIAWCRRALATSDALSAVRRDAFMVLRKAEGLTDTDLDVAVRDHAAIWDRTSLQINALAGALLAAGRADGIQLVDSIVADSPDTLTSDVLEMRGGEAATAITYRRALKGADTAPYLRLAAAGRGVDPRVIALELADDAAADDTTRRALGRALPKVVAQRKLGKGDAELDHEIRVALEILTFESLPTDLRLDVADAFDFVPTRLTNQANRADDHSVDHWSPDGAAALKQRWENAVAQLRAADPQRRWTGLDLNSKLERAREQERGTALTKAQIDWYREWLHDPATVEPGLGFCLGMLLDANALRSDDLDVLLKGWKKRFVKAPDTYDRHRPGMLSLGIALAEVNHPGAQKFFDGVRTLKPKWAAAARNILMGWYGDEADLEPLWARSLSGADRTAVGWALLRARIGGISIVEACDEAIGRARAEGAPPYVSRAYVIAAIAWGDPDQRLWHYSYDDRSRGWFDRALDVAFDSRISTTMRDSAAGLAASHFLINHPAELRPPAGDEEVSKARSRLEAARRDL